MLIGLFRDARFGPFSNLHTCISPVVVCHFGQCLDRRFSLIYIFFFSCVLSCDYRCAKLAILVSASQTMLTGLFEDARFGLISNLHTCILLVEVYRFGHSFCERFSPLSPFFSLVSSRACRDAPYSRFRCGNPNQC